jgi:hypothetical protein
VHDVVERQLAEIATGAPPARCASSTTATRISVPVRQRTRSHTAGRRRPDPELPPLPGARPQRPDRRRLRERRARPEPLLPATICPATAATSCTSRWRRNSPKPASLIERARRLFFCIPRTCKSSSTITDLVLASGE